MSDLLPGRNPLSVGRSPPIRPIERRRSSGPQLTISGQTINSVGAPLDGCEVHLFETDTDIEVDQTTSDINGNYSFPITPANAYKHYYCVAYKAGSPDVSGTTVNTLSAR